MGLWVDKRTQSDIVYWDVRLTKGDSAYIRIYLKDLQDQDIDPRANDVIRFQIRTAQGHLVHSGEAERVDDQIILHLSPSDTSALPAGTYVWDMQLELYDTGDIFTFVPESAFTLLGEVTK